MIHNGLDSAFQIESPIWLSTLLEILIWYKYEIFVINSGNGKFVLLFYGFQSDSVYFVIQSRWFGPYLKLFHLQKEQVINSSQILPKTLFILLAETQDIQDDTSESRKNNSPLTLKKLRGGGIKTRPVYDLSLFSRAKLQSYNPPVFIILHIYNNSMISNSEF